MNKIAQYLNTHMIGEVVTNPAVRKSFATDGSTLSHVPDMVSFPRATSDIRKAARFAWQLAEKGHSLPLVSRGAGTDTSGGAVGGGMVIAMASHMDRIFEYDSKQKLVRLQPGVTVSGLQNALSLHGTSVPELHWEHSKATIGGVLASSRHSGECVDQIEVVLASGDVLQTKRVSKRDLAKIKGQTGFESDIYRAIDALIDDNQDLLDDIAGNDDRLEHEGYAGIEQVKDRDGSIDLAPLFIGSQGTLGIISEMILKADFVNVSPTVVVASFPTTAEAHDAIDIADELDVTRVEYVDAGYLAAAQSAGKTFTFIEEATAEIGTIAATLIVTLNDFNERNRSKKLKKLLSRLKPLAPHVVTTNDVLNSDLRSLESITYWALNPDEADLAAPPLLDGVYVPTERFEDFSRNLAELARQYHVALPLYGRPLDELWYVRPVLRLATTADKQKLLKLSSELIDLVEKYRGTAFGAGGEGRFAAALRDEKGDIADLYRKVKHIFDPHGILNPGVKQPQEVRELAKQIRSSYQGPAATDHMAKF
jgi:FAD/FMN-containing dehydrogenase